MRILIVESVTFFKAEIQWKEFGHNKWLKLDFVEKHWKLSGADKNLAVEKMRKCIEKINHQAFFWVFYVLATVLEIQDDVALALKLTVRWWDRHTQSQ